MKTFIVLGMHRSATSLAAQGLAKSGVWMGDRLLGAHPTNPYGHWEDVAFINMNDKILRLAGGAWDKPPPESAIVQVGIDISKEICDFIHIKAKEPFWGWKDPRTSLTIRCYMPHLFEMNPHFIACYRKPSQIAASLYKRDQIPLKDGEALARVYNNRIRNFLDEWYN